MSKGNPIDLLDDARTSFPYVRIPPPRQCFQERDEELVNYAFPKSISGRPHLDKWLACEFTIQHALALANMFHGASNVKKQRLETLPGLQEPMESCVCYGWLFICLKPDD